MLQKSTTNLDNFFFSVEQHANTRHNNEEVLVDSEEISDELEPGETEVPGYVDYRDSPYIPPQLTSAQENEIVEKFRLLKRKGKMT